MHDELTLAIDVGTGSTRAALVDGGKLLLIRRKSLPSIEELSAPELGLAGVRIETVGAAILALWSMMISDRPERFRTIPAG